MGITITTCVNATCTCKATECVVDGKPINPGEIVCSQLCLEELDLTTTMADYEAVMYPHS
jgi:hypothetical protein